MNKRNTRKPIIGPAFDADQTNDSGRIGGYLSELRYYRPRGFAALVKEGERIVADMESDDPAKYADSAERADDWKDAVEALLTQWARRILRHDFIWFGPFLHSGDVGFQIDVDRADEEADLRIEAGDSVPRGFSGLAVFVNDHGNVHAQTYSRGRMTRELFSVV